MPTTFAVERFRSEMRIVYVSRDRLDVRHSFLIQTRAEPLQRRRTDVDRGDTTRRTDRARQPDGEETSAGANVCDARARSHCHRLEDLRHLLPALARGLFLSNERRRRRWRLGGSQARKYGEG